MCSVTVTILFSSPYLKRLESERASLVAAESRGSAFKLAKIEGSGTHAHRTHAVIMAGVTRRWVGVMEGPTGAPLEVALQAFLGLKNRNCRPFGSRNTSETAEKRLEKRPSFGQGRGQRFF
jgi:hypothetical protein